MQFCETPISFKKNNERVIFSNWCLYGTSSCLLWQSKRSNRTGSMSNKIRYRLLPKRCHCHHWYWPEYQRVPSLLQPGLSALQHLAESRGVERETREICERRGTMKTDQVLWKEIIKCLQLHCFFCWKLSKLSGNWVRQVECSGDTPLPALSHVTIMWLLNK